MAGSLKGYHRRQTAQERVLKKAPSMRAAGEMQEVLSIIAPSTVH
jgi:hypothetical protein